VICALWLIPFYVLSLCRDIPFHQPVIFHNRLLCRGEDRTPDKCLIREFIAYLERCRARPKFPESPDFSNLQGLRPWAFSRLVPDNSEWLGDVEEVGAGSSDSVVRWMKKDQDGNILDEVAVKTMPYEDEGDFSLYRIKGLNQEARLQSQINSLEYESIVHLRGPKFSPTEDCSRLCLEYAPHGNLERLRFRYRCMQRYLPETFLWRVFFHSHKLMLRCRQRVFERI
jgi:hypothetical protein